MSLYHATTTQLLRAPKGDAFGRNYLSSCADDIAQRCQQLEDFVHLHAGRVEQLQAKSGFIRAAIERSKIREDTE